MKAAQVTKVTDELKPMSQSGDFRILVACVAGLVIAIGALFISRRILDPSDVQFLQTAILSVGVPGVLGSGATVLKGTNDRRSAKLAYQVAKAVAPSKYGGLIDMAGQFLGSDDDSDVAVQDDEAVADDESEVQL